MQLTSRHRRLAYHSLLVTWGVCACALGAWAQDDPVARVNGEAISRQAVVARLMADYGSTVLEQLIQELVVAQESKRLGIEVTDKEVHERLQKELQNLPPNMTLEEALRQFKPPLSVFSYREFLRMWIRLERMVAKEVAVSEAEVTQFFSKVPDLFQQPEQMMLHALAVADKRAADELVAQVKRGADMRALPQNGKYKNFAQFIDLGWRRSGTIPGVPAEAKKGFVSDVVTVPGDVTQAHWIYRVVDKRPGRTRKLDEVRDEVRAVLTQQRLAEVAGRKLQELMKAAAPKIARMSNDKR